ARGSPRTGAVAGLCRSAPRQAAHFGVQLARAGRRRQQIRRRRATLGCDQRPRGGRISRLAGPRRSPTGPGRLAHGAEADANARGARLARWLLPYVGCRRGAQDVARGGRGAKRGARPAGGRQGGPHVQFQHCATRRRLADLGCTANANARRPVEVLSTRKRESPPPRSAIADGFRFADRSRPGSRRRRLWVQDVAVPYFNLRLIDLKSLETVKTVRLWNGNNELPVVTAD